MECRTRSDVIQCCSERLSYTILNGDITVQFLTEQRLQLAFQTAHHMSRFIHAVSYASLIASSLLSLIASATNSVRTFIQVLESFGTSGRHLFTL